MARLDPSSSSIKAKTRIKYKSSNVSGSSCNYFKCAISPVSLSSSNRRLVSQELVVVVVVVVEPWLSSLQLLHAVVVDLNILSGQPRLKVISVALSAVSREVGVAHNIQGHFLAGASFS